MSFGFFAFGCEIDAFCHVPHDSPHGIASLGKRERAATSKRDTALLPMPIVLREVCLATARHYPHGKPSLVVIEDEHVPLAIGTQAGCQVDSESRQKLRWPTLTRTLIDTIPWQAETARIFGREMHIPRLTAWLGDGAYAYSGVLHLPAPFPAIIDLLRERA